MNTLVFAAIRSQPTAQSAKEMQTLYALKQELPYKRSLDPKISTGRAAVLD